MNERITVSLLTTVKPVLPPIPVWKIVPGAGHMYALMYWLKPWTHKHPLINMAAVLLFAYVPCEVCFSDG